MKNWKKAVLILFHFAVIMTILSVFWWSPPVVVEPEDPDYPFKWEIYQRLIQDLQEAGYTFLLPREYLDYNGQGKFVVIVHDCDFDLRGVQSLSYVENMMGVRSCWYLRPNAEYFVRKITAFQELETAGWEIGMHYDCLSCMDGDREKAVPIFEWQLEFIRRYFDVVTVRGHGDKFNINVDNKDLVDSEWFADLEIYEMHPDFSIPKNVTYIRDTDGELVIPSPLSDRILINFHSDHWK